jgi:predicted AAA+ superfamily ATPase
MLQRKAYDRLVEWKNQRQGRSAMLIEGARRVGKSVLAEEFGRREYAACLLIDFSEASAEIKELFATQRHDLPTFFRYLFAFYQFKPVERNTLIIFDEVQLFPQARAFIKQLVADGRYDYMETGSLISIRRNVQDILIPSEEQSIDLNPFDFEEFLWALDEKDLADLIRDSFTTLTPLPTALHRKAERLLREYMLVGGMPQAVQEYARTGDFHESDVMKRQILNLYRNDIAKYAMGEESKVSAIFDAIPGQLSKHEKKFKLAAMGESARYRNYESAFFWLSDARLVNMCFNSTDPNIGLGLNLEQSSFKCYMADTGLLVSHALADRETTSNDMYRDILFDKLSVNEGMFCENLVAQQLKASGRKLFFHSTYDEQSHRSFEIDFLITRPYRDAAGRTRISPIEVKSGKTYGTSSLDRFRAIYGKRLGTEYVLHPKPLTVEGDRVYLPLYMGGLL